jgi:predicted nucleic acid-binding protein
MVAVADTSPVNYLVLIGRVEILRHLYRQVLIPPAVVSELRHAAAPGAVRQWAARLPEWVDVRTAAATILPDLDAGESQAIWLAQETAADVLLIDDWAGRREAVQRGLRVAGTLAVLDEADRRGLLGFEDAVAQLRASSFRLSGAVLEQIRSMRGS